MSIVSEIVREASRKGMSRGELAKRSGLTASGLSRISNARHGARLDTIERMAGVVGMKLMLAPNDDYASKVLSGTLMTFDDVDGT